MLGTAIFFTSLLAATPPQEPKAFDFAQQLAAILPAGDELAWRSVPWRAEFRTALVEASQAGKPVLLWAMNGHPLGQT